jgi:protein-S-isoprenylcysteine O-methyltransferase Ste14
MPFKYFDVVLVIIFFLIYLLLWLIKKQELLKLTGVNANVIFKAKRPIQKYFGVLERFMTMAIIIIVILNVFLPGDNIFTKRLFGSGSLTVKLIGSILAALGLALCRIAQITIGKSWRVGIDEDTKPGLIKTGIYSLVRNPTYSGLFLLCLGVFAVLPTVSISYWVLAFFIMMEFQVRCEEEFLEMQYGQEYIKYSKKVKRYIPYIY